MKFEQLYSLVTIEEGAFRKSKNRIHLVDLPMFSIFLQKSMLDANEERKGPYNLEFFKDVIPELSEIFVEAKKQIGKLGFASMHANVVIDDLSERVNHNTGGRVGGYASGKSQGRGRVYDNHVDSGVNYMRVDLNSFLKENNGYAVSIVVHEWAHLWMFNKNKAFQNAIKKFYYDVLANAASEIPNAVAAIDNDIKLPYELEIKMINAWSSTWDYDAYQRNSFINTFVAYKLKIKEDNLHLIPFQLRIEATLNKDTYLQRSLIKAGDTVYVIRGYGDKWIIGPGTESSLRDEITLPLNDIFDIFEKKSFLEKINAQIAQTLKYYKTKTSPAELQNRLSEIAYSGLKAAYDAISKERIDTSEWEKMTKEWSKDFLYPQLINGSIKDLREKMSLSKYHKEHRFYDYIWASNPKKPEGLSVTKMMTDLYAPIEQRNRHKAIQKEIFTFNLSGAEKETVRQLTAAVSEWPSSYGMSNDDEIWATAIELFFKLPMKYRKVIMDMVYSYS